MTKLIVDGTEIAKPSFWASVPWAAYVVGVGFILLMLPWIGVLLAGLIYFGVLMAWAAAMQSLHLANAFGSADTLFHVSFGVVAFVLAVTALVLTLRLRRPDLTAQQASASLNGLVLVIGIPVLLGLAFLRVSSLWR